MRRGIRLVLFCVLACSEPEPDDVSIAVDAGQQQRDDAVRGGHFRRDGGMVFDIGLLGIDASVHDGGGMPGRPTAGRGGIGGGASGTGGGASGTGGDPDMDGGVDPDEEPDRLNRDIFDPRRVYLSGTVVQGLCGRDIIAQPETPEWALVGFHCSFDSFSAVIHPSSGRLTYLNTSESLLREFRCDHGCDYWQTSFEYPLDPQQNDPVLDTAPCDQDEHRFQDFLVAPDGQRLHRCDGVWYDQAGTPVYSSTATLACLGPNQTAFTHNDVLIDLTTGDEIPITGLPLGTTRTCRATAAGFWVVVLPAASPEDTPELWEVGVDGAAVLVGTYPAPPAGHGLQNRSKIDASGALYQMGSFGTGLDNSVVVRRTIEGESEVVYVEADQPFLKAHGATLITGP